MPAQKKIHHTYTLSLLAAMTPFEINSLVCISLMTTIFLLLLGQDNLCWFVFQLLVACMSTILLFVYRKHFDQLKLWKLFWHIEEGRIENKKWEKFDARLVSFSQRGLDAMISGYHILVWGCCGIRCKGESHLLWYFNWFSLVHFIIDNLFCLSILGSGSETWGL